jgi:hypothetical protein
LVDRAQHDLDYNEAHDEFYIANPLAQAILTFRGGANGNEAPIRIIQGPSTQIQSPDFGLQVDTVNNEIFEVEHDSILVFPRTGNGDIAPLRVLKGPNTQLENPYGENAVRSVGVDPINNVLVVTGDFVNRGRILIFDRTASGNAKPLRVIMGPKTLLGSAGYHMRMYPPKGWILQPVTGGGIGVWSVHDNGDVPPRFLLGGPISEAAGRGAEGDSERGGGGGFGGGGGGAGNGGFGGLNGGFALNPKGKELIIGGGAQVSTYSFPEIF